ncbi:ATP-binding protein [Petralouisia muris]|uniref:ATP-binding protein n=1 Tax=Petralouisia muris TaxID=3032872 RepID=A0AC61RQ39_9FIRM|nr:ATP-binding protein [Petralouisia muris]TGY88654.1 ATP-binding protein [Petralouisia muris]
MKQTVLKLPLFINSILLIAYMGLTAHADLHLNTRGVIPLVLSSLLLIDVTYISSCNIRKNKTISLFCGLLALESWYILLSASGNSITNIIFFALSPVIWCVSIKFILMFLFQNSGYKYQKLINLCLTGTCICTLIGILASSKIFFLLYGIQFMASWLCFIFTVIYHRKRIAFVFKSEWKHITFSFIVVMVLFLTYSFSTMRVPEHLSNFGIYIPILLFWVSVHGIILNEHNSLPLSAVFNNCQLTLLIFTGVIIFSMVAMILDGGYSLLFIMLDALFAFLYVCNIALDFNFKKGQNKIIRESKYHVALQQLQREEQLNLEFANFLHDDILQDLLSVKNMMKKADHPEVQKIITETLDNMNTYIREQMQDYHPMLLPKLTIKENYQNLLDGISQSFPNRNICVSFDCSDSLFLVEPYNIFVYRLLKELVMNVYKHSTGEKAWITLTQDKGIIILNVSDNGTVDADVLLSADKLKHRGLAMITERVNDMDGSVTISNNHPHGICIQTILPMKGDVSYQHFVSR